MSLTSFLISSTVLPTKKWRCDYHNEIVRTSTIEDVTSYVEYAHYSRQFFLPTGNTIFVRLRVEYHRGALSAHALTRSAMYIFDDPKGQHA